MNIRKKDAVKFLKELMRSRKCSISRLAADLGVSHSTVSRWVSAKYLPDASSCVRLSEYSGVPLVNILNTMGYTSIGFDGEPIIWPEFREYAKKKYPHILNEDIITMIESLINHKENEKHGEQDT